MHQSIILGEWSNTIGYEMGPTLAGVYTMTKTYMVDNFKDGWKLDMSIFRSMPIYD